MRLTWNSEQRVAIVVITVVSESGAGSLLPMLIKMGKQACKRECSVSAAGKDTHTPPPGASVELRPREGKAGQQVTLGGGDPLKQRVVAETTFRKDGCDGWG